MHFKYLKYIVMLSIILIAHQAFTQAHLMSEVKVSQKSIYVGQPVQVSVGVFTSTWFTSGINPGNIKVNGAFTVYFRSVSQSKTIDGKNYAGVELIFNVFPYDDEDIVFPVLEFEVETPDEGGYKAVKRIVKTSERKIKVKPIPKGYEKDKWLVASGMTVDDNWTGDLNNVKVGDVLERSISCNVAGTVSELIPPIIWDTLQGVSLYPSRSEVSSDKTKASISASRTDGMRYLFEKEGSVTVPSMELTWWDPDQNKLYKRTLKSYTINVLPNPDLGMLESLRDSLAISIVQEEGLDGNTSSETIFGLSKKELIILTIILLIAAFLMYKFFKWLFSDKGLVAQVRKRHELYLESEAYYFKQFKSTLKKKDATASLQSLYRWLDKLHLKEPTMQYFAATFGSDELVKEWSEAEDKNNWSGVNIKNLEKARSRYLKSLEQISTASKNNWINP